MTDAIEQITAARDKLLADSADCISKAKGLDYALQILAGLAPGHLKPAATQVEKPKGVPPPAQLSAIGRQIIERADALTAAREKKEKLETPVQSKTVLEKPMSVFSATNEAGKADMPPPSRLLSAVPDSLLEELHARGLNDMTITGQLKEDGWGAYQSGVSKRLRALGLAPHGQRNGGGRKRKNAGKPAEPEEEPEEETAEDPIPEEEEDEGPFYGKPREEEADTDLPFPMTEPEPEESGEEPEDDDGAMAACRELGARCSVREMHGTLLYRLDGAFAPPHEIVKAARQAARSEKLRKATERTA